MKRLVVLLALFVSACRGSASPPTPSPGARPPAPARPNVLLITVDTLRADHLGLYGYRRRTSPHMDALGRDGTVFDRAYTFWPKTRGSMVILHTGRRPSQNGYTRSHPALLPFNPTLAGTLRGAGYSTAALVDNPNVAAEHGYAQGFETYRQTWEEPALKTEAERGHAITAGAVAFLAAPPPGRPFFLWLHYVNPHAPYTPPPPFDTAFLDEASRTGPRLPLVPGFHEGIHREWALPGHDQLGYYVSQYDGEIATADAEVGRVLQALSASPAAGRTVVVLTSDHGESLGEHGYYFDHGEDLFDPCLRVPLVVRVPGVPGGHRSPALASTLDLVPTLLDAVKVSYPPDLAGASLLPAVKGGEGPARRRLFAQNDRDLSAAFDAQEKVVATPVPGGVRYALYDRASDPGETHDMSSRAEAFRKGRRELELFLDQSEREWAETRRRIQGGKGADAMTPRACEELKALGYLASDFRCPP